MADNNKNFKLNRSETEMFIEQLKKPQHIDTDSIINPPKKKYKRGMCVVCLKMLDNEKEIADMMCDKCETTTAKIANEFNVIDRFDIVENKDRKRWEFDPKGNWIGYTVSFFECETKEDAIIAIWKALKMQSV